MIAGEPERARGGEQRCNETRLEHKVERRQKRVDKDAADMTEGAIEHTVEIGKPEKEEKE